MRPEPGAPADRDRVPDGRGRRHHRRPRLLGRTNRRRALRGVIMVATVVLCVGAGLTASQVAFGVEYQWPLPEGNVREAVGMGLCGGAFGATMAAVALWYVPRKALWITAAVAVVATWGVTFAVVWRLITDQVW